MAMVMVMVFNSAYTGGTWMYTSAVAGTLWLRACCKLWLLALTGTFWMSARCELCCRET